MVTFPSLARKTGPQANSSLGRCRANLCYQLRQIDSAYFVDNLAIHDTCREESPEANFAAGRRKAQEFILLISVVRLEPFALSPEP